MVPTSTSTPVRARDSLLALAERCEREDPSYELDCKIEHLAEPERARHIANARPYTSSLDAAVTLVPKRRWKGVGPELMSQQYHQADSGNWWAELRDGVCTSFNVAFLGRAKTLPIAICAASLRARAALESK